MNVEQRFREMFPEFCNGEVYLSPYFDLFQAGINLMQEENERLKQELNDANEKVVNLACNQNKDLERKYNNLCNEVLSFKNEFMAVPLDNMEVLSEIIERFNNL